MYDTSHGAERVELSLIRTDGGTQPRANIDARLVTEYAEAMAEEFEFPPVTVFFDGRDYWLADGFHRVAAVQALGFEDIACRIRQGTREDAVWFSCGANATHGRRRSNEDKRRAVETALADPRSEQLSNRDLARHCGVSHTYVSKLRRVANGEPLDDDELRTAPTPQAISAASKVTTTGVVADPRDIEVDEDSPGVLVRKSEAVLDGLLRDAAERLAEPDDVEDGFVEVENRGGGGGGGEGGPREVEIEAAEERPAAEKRTIKLPRDPQQAAHVILKNFSRDQVETLIAILESNL